MPTAEASCPIDRCAGPGMIIGNAAVFIFDLDIIEHVLKFTDDNHIAVNPDKISSEKFFLSSAMTLVVLINRYGTEAKFAWFADIFRIDELTFGHFGLNIEC